MIYVIMPVFNSEKFLSKSIESLLNQTYKDFTLICVNDGSTDSSSSIIESFSKINKNIVVINKINGGASSARNAALNYIKDINSNDYICFIDSDDYVENDYLEKLYCKAKKYECDIVCSSNKISTLNSLYNDSHNFFFKEEIMRGYNSLLSLFSKNGYSGYVWAKLFRANLFSSMRFNENIKVAEDLDVLYRIFSLADNVMFTDYCGYYYTENVDSILHEKFNNDVLLKIIKVYLNAYNFEYKNFSYIEIKKLKKNIFKEFGRIYIMYMHKYDFKNQTSSDIELLKSIKANMNVRKAALLSHTRNIREIMKKIIFIVVGERRFSRL